MLLPSSNTVCPTYSLSGLRTRQYVADVTPVQVSREAGPVKGGKTVIAFVEDPTGYKWELIERKGEIEEPLAQV